MHRQCSSVHCPDMKRFWDQLIQRLSRLSILFMVSLINVDSDVANMQFDGYAVEY